jgi:hypothetical protein
MSGRPDERQARVVASRSSTRPLDANLSDVTARDVVLFSAVQCKLSKGLLAPPKYTASAPTNPIRTSSPAGVKPPPSPMSSRAADSAGNARAASTTASSMSPPRCTRPKYTAAAPRLHSARASANSPHRSQLGGARDTGGAGSHRSGRSRRPDSIMQGDTRTRSPGTSSRLRNTSAGRSTRFGAPPSSSTESVMHQPSTVSRLTTLEKVESTVARP